MSIRFIERQIGFGLLMVGLSVSICSAKDVVISPESDVESIAKSIQAGDSIVLANGRWVDVRLKFERLGGTKQSPILIRPESSGGVVFTGETELRISGEHVIVSGFVFRNTRGVSDVVQLRTHSKRLAHHCRLTDCIFEQTADVEAGTESRWLSLYGTDNRVDHCYFGGKRSRGPTMVVWVSESRERHRIDHNHFGPRPELGRNGGETIRIGTSDVSEFECGTVVEENYFYKCDGEAEIISNKSCDNLYRHNVFDECSGALTLRHGHRCTVDGNVFLGRKARGTGGVRIIGRDHVVTNNYFEGLRGDAERAAISVMNGIPDGPLNGYAPVVGAVVANNTLVDCKVSMELGLGAGETQSERPVHCVISHNAVVSGKWEIFRVHSAPVDTKWTSNHFQLGNSVPDPLFGFKQAPLNLVRAADGLLRPKNQETIRCDANSPVKNDIDGFPRTAPTLVGCDDPTNRNREWPSPASTGPVWRRAKRTTPNQ